MIPHKSFRIPAPGKWLLDKNRPPYTPSYQTDIKATFDRIRAQTTKLRVAA